MPETSRKPPKSGVDSSVGVRARVSPKRQRQPAAREHTEQAPALPPLHPKGLPPNMGMKRATSRLVSVTRLGAMPMRLKKKKEPSAAERAIEWQRQRAERMRQFKPPATNRMTNEQLQHAKKAFFSIDTDGSGTIDVDELTACLKTLGFNPSKEDIARIMGCTDGDGDNRIDLREFLEFYAQGLSPQSAAEQAEHDLKELHVALGGGGESISKTKLQELLQDQFDIDVQIDDLFKAVWKTGKTASVQDLEAGLDDDLTLAELKRIFLDAPPTA